MKIKFMLAFMCIALVSFAQAQQTEVGPTFVGDAELVSVTPSLLSRINELTPGSKKGEAKDGRYSKTRLPKADVVPGKGSKRDILSENKHPLSGKIQSRTAELVWDAGYTFSNPTDPALAVGPDHVMVVWNTAFAIFDKDGNELLGDTNPFPAIFPSNGCCDLTASYDVAADRWVLSFLGGGAQIAVSQTGNPLTTAWNIYDIPTVNDYNKVSVWSDGYYLTDQSGGDRLYAMDRQGMLDGNATVSIQGFQLPGIATFGFASPQVLNVTDGNMPAPGNATIVFFQDDAYAGVNKDHIKFWNANVDFVTPGNSTVSVPQEIDVSDFTSIFDGGSFVNLPQPNGGDSLDALQGIVMNQAQFRKFPTYNSAVFNHVVDSDPTAGKLAAVRWYEFRQSADGQPWALFQEGTYNAPDGKHAWNASLMMDNQGNIGMGYTAMGGDNNTTLGSYYTGRFTSDPPGVMTVTENDIALGEANILGQRYGDYSKIDIDPLDDQTFYFTNEVHTTDTPNAAQRAANVGRFKIAPDADIDMGIIDILTPIDGDLGTAEVVQVMVRNFGTVAQSNISVSYTIDGGATITEVITGPIPPVTNVMYTFTGTANLSTDGQSYSICAKTTQPNDEFLQNDEFCKDVISLNDIDTGVISITSPISGTGLTTMETVTVVLENFGAVTQTNIPVFYTLDGGSPIMETYTGSLTQGATDTYTFTESINLSNLGDYTIVAGTELVGDANQTNDDTTKEVTNFNCQPESNCDGFSDGVTQIQLADQDITTNCGTNPAGYSDDTDTIFNFILQDNPFLGTLQVGFDDSTFAIWIDFNDNNAFEPSELVANDIVANQNQDFDFTIDFETISGVTNGMHLMRIRGEDDDQGGELLDPCDDLVYGRTNDYTANISGAALSVDSSDFSNAKFIISSLDNNLFDLKLSTTAYTTKLPVYIYNTLGQVLAYYTLENTGSGYNKTIDMSYVSSGVYFVKIGNADLNKVKRIIVK